MQQGNLSLSPSSLLARYCKAVITPSMRFMEWLTLNVMFVKIVGEGTGLVFDSVIPLNATIDILLVKITLTKQY